MDRPPARQPTSPASYADFDEPRSGGVLRTIVQFFAIPLLIVGVAVGLYVCVSLVVGGGPTTTADFVKLLGSDTINRRWQAAYELSQRLGGAEVPPEFREQGLVDALHSTLRLSREGDAKQPDLAKLVLTILARIESPTSVEPVRAALEDSDDQIRSFAALVLGKLGDRGSVEPLRRLAREHPDGGTRQASLFALAMLDQVEGVRFQVSDETLVIARTHLGDPVPDVRFQAALLVARSGEIEAARPFLLNMLDREHLAKIGFAVDESLPDKIARFMSSKMSGVDPHQVRTNLILETVEALSRLPIADDEAIVGRLELLSKAGSEPDLHVREAARKALLRVQSKRN